MTKVAAVVTGNNSPGPLFCLSNFGSTLVFVTLQNSQYFFFKVFFKSHQQDASQIYGPRTPDFAKKAHITLSVAPSTLISGQRPRSALIYLKYTGTNSGNVVAPVQKPQLRGGDGYNVYSLSI